MSAASAVASVVLNDAVDQQLTNELSEKLIHQMKNSTTNNFQQQQLPATLKSDLTTLLNALRLTYQHRKKAIQQVANRKQSLEEQKQKIQQILENE